MQETLGGLDFCIVLAATAEGLTLGTAADRLRSAGFCFVALLAGAPFLQPVSLGPVTMASGGVLMLVGWQMMRGERCLVLPEKVRSFVIRGTLWTSVLKFCRRLLLWITRITRPRWSGWVDGVHGSRNVGWLIFTGGLLLAVPCANLPFNNTLPALMALFAVVGWLEKDGVMALASITSGVLALAYFAGVGAAVFWLGANVFSWMQ